MKWIRVPPKSNDDRPFLVIWEVTQACDLACSHCRANAMPNSDPRALNFEQGKALIDQVHAFGSPYPLIVFTGGDPFKRADLFQLIEYASSLGLSPAVSPSATSPLRRLQDGPCAAALPRFNLAPAPGPVR